MSMFFSNLNLALIQKRLSYKNIDEIQALLTKLLYGKVTCWTKSLKIYSVIANVASKEYLMYYLNIILAICFLIGHQPFALYMAFAPVRRYLTVNLNNNDIDNNKDKHIYRVMHMADWW